MRVLVVDDDAGIRTLVTGALDTMDVLEAADGASALETLRTTAVDVVLLDVMMPGMDGFEVLSRIRRTGSFDTVSVIMLTAKVSEADHVRAFRAGADAYITKPFDIDDLTSTVQEVCHMSANDRAQARKDELDKAELLRQIEQRFANF